MCRLKPAWHRSKAPSESKGIAVSTQRHLPEQSLVLAAGSGAAGAARSGGTVQTHDLQTPGTKDAPRSGKGSGFSMDGQRAEQRVSRASLHSAQPAVPGAHRRCSPKDKGFDLHLG